MGSHRRVLLRALLEYQRRDDARRDQILRELTREAEDLGPYVDGATDGPPSASSITG